MMTTTYLHDQEASEGVRQSNAMGLAIKRYVTTLVIITLTILAGVQFVNGQPQQMICSLKKIIEKKLPPKVGV